MIKRYSIVASALAVLCFATLNAGPKKANVESPPAAPSKGSIHVKGKPKTTVLMTMAKISFQDALATALNAVPGRVASGELEAEDGTLQYEFEIVTAANKVMDVSIDAGDGKVLDVDDGDDN